MLDVRTGDLTGIQGCAKQGISESGPSEKLCKELAPAQLKTKEFDCRLIHLGHQHKQESRWPMNPPFAHLEEDLH